MLFILLSFFAMLLEVLSQQAYECRAPEGTNFQMESKAWCNLTAIVKISDKCSTQVEEIIQVPWAYGKLVRYIPHQTNQEIKQVSAFEITDKGRIELPLSEVQRDVRRVNTLVHIRAPVTRESFTISLQYEVERGVELYYSCRESASIFKVSRAPTGGKSDNQLVKWSPGGQSATEIKVIGASFLLSKSAKTVFVESAVGKPAEFSLLTKTNNKSPSENYRVSHEGNATGISPTSVTFYFRYLRVGSDDDQCHLARMCEEEKRRLLERFLTDGSKRAIIILSVGLGLLFLVLLIGVWISCYKSLKKKKAENMDSLPISLRHFAFDTGEERSSGQLAKWTQERTGAANI